MAAGQRRTLRAMKAKVLALAAEWDGIDGSATTVLEELAEEIQKSEDFLLEPVESGN